MLDLAQLPLWKRLVVIGCGLLALVGVADAIYNLPVVTGCAFYGNCRNEEFRDPPGELGRDVP
jgi:TRAP-type mannitol/chloroaromatic compound transport system permease small subunit